MMFKFSNYKLVFTLAVFVLINITLGTNDDSTIQKSDDPNVSIVSVRKCVESKIKNIQTETKDRKEALSFEHIPTRPYIAFSNAFDDEDITHLLILSACVKEFSDEENSIERKFGNKTGEETAYDAGGNNVTFIGGYISAILPELDSRIRDVASESTEVANYRPHPQHLGIRCAEILEYGPGGELKLHVDSDSIFTLIFMLSDSSDYDGGSFFIEDRSDDTLHYELKAPKYGGFLFDSNVNHGVDKLNSGKRLVMAVEFWPFEDISPDDARPGISDKHLPMVPLFKEVILDTATNVSHFSSIIATKSKQNRHVGPEQGSENDDEEHIIKSLNFIQGLGFGSIGGAIIALIIVSLVNHVTNTKSQSAVEVDKKEVKKD